MKHGFATCLSDTLIGGDGSDTLIADLSDDLINAGGGSDSIMDWLRRASDCG